MTQRLILYTSNAEGITIGVVGETWMEALLALSEEFGEGVMPLYEKTREELTNTSAALAETFAEEVEAVAAGIASKVGDEAEQPPFRVPAHDEESSAGPDAAPDAGSSATAPAGKNVCAVCGADVTEDFALFTREMHGEERCPSCIG